MIASHIQRERSGPCPFGPDALQATAEHAHWHGKSDELHGFPRRLSSMASHVVHGRGSSSIDGLARRVRGASAT